MIDCEHELDNGGQMSHPSQVLIVAGCPRDGFVFATCAFCSRSCGGVEPLDDGVDAGLLAKLVL